MGGIGEDCQELSRVDDVECSQRFREVKSVGKNPIRTDGALKLLKATALNLQNFPELNSLKDKADNLERSSNPIT